MKKELLFPVLFVLSITLSSFLSPISARGGLRSTSGSEIGNVSARRLLEGRLTRTRVDVAQGYMTNVDLEKAMKEFGKRCSSISRIYSIGKSVDGFPLWVIEISDRPGEVEPEPAFKFIGNVHGDEPVGRELLIHLANWICDNYPKDPLARLIVEDVHLHLLPSMNPDGYSRKQRGNANGIDLNRDFPDQFFPMNDDMNNRQPETMAIMNWLREIRFTASASLHGGALVANYPWDGTQDKRRTYYACPDDEAFQFMASVYSRSHYNMSLSKEFEGGITNGAAWYPIYGGMQDWNYIYGDCFELTLEISDNKWPKAIELPTIWEYNRLSMLNLVASVAKTGVHGRLFSSDSGRPLPGSIKIKDINYTVKAGREFADYHRMLAPGRKYEVTASMPGYKPKTTSVLLEENGTSLDFILDPEVEPKKGLQESVNDFSYNSMGRIELVLGRIEVYCIVIIFLVFLWFMFRRMKLNLVKHRQAIPPRRSAVV